MVIFLIVKIVKKTYDINGLKNIANRNFNNISQQTYIINEKHLVGNLDQFRNYNI